MARYNISEKANDPNYVSPRMKQNSPVTQEQASGMSTKELSIALAGGQSDTPTPTPSINRTVQEDEKNTPDFYGDAYKQESADAQRQINLLNKYADEQLQSLQPRQDERLRETASVNTLTGLGGSTEANVQTEKTSAVNKREDDLVRAEAAAKAQAILGNVSTKAATRATSMREQFAMDADAEAAQRTETIGEIATLASSGINADAYKASDPEGYAYLADAVGGEEMLKAHFTLNRSAETVLDKRIEGGKYVIAYQNPIDGKVRVESVDLGLPTGYTKTLDAGDRILAIPDNWDGSPESLITINKGLTPSQASSKNDSASNLPSNQQIDNERALLGYFKGEPIVKNYNEVLNKKLSVDSIIQNGASGPRDLALVFEFMKALDPTSVVRESEYEAAAKSGNIFAGVYAKFNGYLKEEGGMLPENVKQEFNAITDSKLEIAQKQFDNLSSEYQGVAERQGLDPRNIVLGYQGALDSVPEKKGTSTADKADAAGYDYQAMVDAGYTDEEIETAISQ